MITSALQAQCIQSNLLCTRKSTVRPHQLLRMNVLSVQDCYTHPRRSCLKADTTRDRTIIRVNCALGEKSSWYNMLLDHIKKKTIRIDH